MVANSTKKINFSGYQIDLHYLERNGGVDVDAIKWSGDFIQKLFEYLMSINKVDRKMNVGDQWFLVLEEVQYDEKYVYGSFKSAEYGRNRNLVHADTLIARTNPKDRREGEEDLTHFLIRKIDGFLLLQGHQKVLRARIDEYIDRYAKDFILNSNNTYINICSLFGLEFIEELRKLDKVKSTVIEIAASDPSDDNEFIQDIQERMEDIHGTHVALEFKAKYQRSGLGKIIPFIQKYKGQRGVSSIKIVGDQDGAERKINVDSYSEKYGKKVKVDGNNNPMSESAYEQLINIADKRSRLFRS